MVAQGVPWMLGGSADLAAQSIEADAMLPIIGQRPLMQPYCGSKQNIDQQGLHEMSALRWSRGVML